MTVYGRDYGTLGLYRMLQACEKVSQRGEQIVLCLEQQIRQHNRAAETAMEVTGILCREWRLIRGPHFRG